MASNRRRWLLRRWHVLLALVALGSTLALCATLHWFAELFVHFVPHYAATALVLALAYAGLRTPIQAALAAALFGYHTVTVWPSAPAVSAHAVVDAIKLLQFNVGLDHTDPDAIARWIEQQDADVVILLEVGDRWQAPLDSLRTTFPYQTSRLLSSPFGIALLSRTPADTLVVEPNTFDPYPHVRAELRTPRAGIPIRIYGVHPPPPINAMLASERDRRLTALAARVDGDDNMPQVIAGDFNVTPWAPLYRSMLRAGWSDARVRHPLQNTWPALPGASLWGIPIDHTLVRGGARIGARQIGPALGSDHLPVASRIEILAPRTSPHVAFHRHSTEDLR